MDPAEFSRYLPLVRLVASRIAVRLPRHVEVDDLVSAGVLGLMNASRQYDASKGVPFDRYAEIRIRGAILDELRGLDQTSRTARQQAQDVAEVTRNLGADLGRAPRSDEIAAGLGVSTDAYLAMVARNSPVVVLGFDDLGLTGDDRTQDVMQYLRDPSAVDPSARTEGREVASALARAIDQLTDRQRQVITFLYFEGMSAREVAGMLGLTEGRISQLHSAAVLRLKQILQGQEDAL